MSHDSPQQRLQPSHHFAIDSPHDSCRKGDDPSKVAHGVLSDERCESTITHVLRKGAFLAKSTSSSSHATAQTRPITRTREIAPLQPFGEAAGGGRTAVQSRPGSALFNANNGEHYIESKPPLTPLDVTIQEPIRTIKCKGKTLTLSQRFESLVELEQVIMSLYFVLPALLNVSFADPPFIERVDGMIGQHGFRWELNDWRMEFQITNQDEQETRVVKAWERVGIVCNQNRRRLIAGLHYFHQACRLARAGATVGEFLAEVILNLSKSLEALFPPSGDGRSRDAIRRGLRSLGICDDDIECNFLPAVALRNEIDVGHVELGLFKMEQLQVIHRYTERAETAFHKLFEQLFEQIESGKFEVEAYDPGAPRAEALQLIDRIKECGGADFG